MDAIAGCLHGLYNTSHIWAPSIILYPLRRSRLSIGGVTCA